MCILIVDQDDNCPGMKFVTAKQLMTQLLYSMVKINKVTCHFAASTTKFDLCLSSSPPSIKAF